MGKSGLALICGAMLANGGQEAHGESPFSPSAPLLTLRVVDFRHPTPEPQVLRFPVADPVAGVSGSSSFSKNRMAVWVGLTASASYLAYEQSQVSWGVSNGRFRFKDDLHDGLALSDETSHLFAAYHLTRALTTGYGWTGLSSTSARRMAALHAWVWTFLVEYPIDAYNPTQGFGVSDLAFNTAGVLAAYQQTRPGSRPWWDIKISVKESFFRGESRFIAHSNEQYDDYIYWVTVRPVRHRYIPIWLGAGYSTTHGVWPQIDKELHLGIGTTVEDLAGVVSPSAGRFLRPLNFLFLNLGTKIVWK